MYFSHRIFIYLFMKETTATDSSSSENSIHSKGAGVEKNVSTSTAMFALFVPHQRVTAKRSTCPQLALMRGEAGRRAVVVVFSAWGFAWCNGCGWASDDGVRGARVGALWPQQTASVLPAPLSSFETIIVTRKLSGPLWKVACSEKI